MATSTMLIFKNISQPVNRVNSQSIRSVCIRIHQAMEYNLHTKSHVCFFRPNNVDSELSTLIVI